MFFFLAMHRVQRERYGPRQSSSSSSFLQPPVSRWTFRRSRYAPAPALYRWQKALSICLALASLKASKLPLSALPSSAKNTRGQRPPRCCSGLPRCSRKIFSTSAGFQPLQNIADRRVGGRPLPTDLERLVQNRRRCVLMNVRMPPVRVGSRHNRQNGKQQNMR